MRRLLFFVLLGIAVIGCGGGSSNLSPGGSPTTRTRDAVKQSYIRALFSAAQSGAFGAGGGTGGSTGSGTTGGNSGGGGFGFPIIGGFIHQFVPVPGRGATSPQQSFLERRLAISRVGTTGSGTDGSTTNGGGSTDGSVSSTGSTAGTSTGGTGGGGWNDFYFDDYLGLWVQTESTDTSFTQHLYADEAKSEPAGLFQTNFPSGWNVFPYQFSSSFAITRGNFTGAHGMYLTTVSSDVKGSSSYENVWPGYGSDKGTSSWNGSSSAWSSEANDTSGAWWKGSGQYFDDGHGSSSYEDSLGFKASFVYNADGSGSARMEGPVPGLPATITWTATGHTRIVYADGTVEEWDAGGYFGGGGEGGTTGVGTGGNTGGSTTGGTGNVTTGGVPHKVK